MTSEPALFDGARIRGCVPAAAMSLAVHAAVLWGVAPPAGGRSAAAETALMEVSFRIPPRAEETAKALVPAAPEVVAESMPRSSAKPSPLHPRSRVAPPRPTMAASGSAPRAVAEPVPAPERIPPHRAPEQVAAAAAAAHSSPASAGVSAPDFKAAYLDNPKPGYPMQSKRHAEQGLVLLRVHVSAEGDVERVDLHSSSGWPRLDRAAEEAVRTWRFAPARRGDTPVSAWVIVPLKFVL